MADDKSRWTSGTIYDDANQGCIFQVGEYRMFLYYVAQRRCRPWLQVPVGVCWMINLYNIFKFPADDVDDVDQGCIFQVDCRAAGVCVSLAP